MIHKHADKLMGRPWDMKDAGIALKDWVDGTEPPTPLLDVQYCSTATSSVVRRNPTVIIDTCHEDALALEPAPGTVTIHQITKRQPKVDDSIKPSPQGKFVYNMALDLVRNHAMTWQRAITTAEDIWKHSSKSELNAIADAEKCDLRSKTDDNGCVVASTSLDDSNGNGEDDEFDVLTDEITR
jgi:hypothetical protein